MRTGKLTVNVLAKVMKMFLDAQKNKSHQYARGKQSLKQLMGSLSNLGVAIEHILPSFHPMDVLIGAVIGVGVRLVVYMKGKNAKKFRKGEEYRSA